jgi:hypothetical protein
MAWSCGGRSNIELVNNLKRKNDSVTSLEFACGWMLIFRFMTSAKFAVWFTVSLLLQCGAGATLFKDPRVEAAMLSCDRKNYCPRDPFNDCPQPIGQKCLLPCPIILIPCAISHAHSRRLQRNHQRTTHGATSSRPQQRQHIHRANTPRALQRTPSPPAPRLFSCRTMIASVSSSPPSRPHAKPRQTPRHALQQPVRRDSPLPSPPQQHTVPKRLPIRQPQITTGRVAVCS